LIIKNLLVFLCVLAYRRLLLAVLSVVKGFSGFPEGEAINSSVTAE